jgi:hypothetical protein
MDIFFCMFKVDFYISKVICEGNNRHENRSILNGRGPKKAHKDRHSVAPASPERRPVPIDPPARRRKNQPTF